MHCIKSLQPTSSLHRSLPRAAPTRIWSPATFCRHAAGKGGHTNLWTTMPFKRKSSSNRRTRGTTTDRCGVRRRSLTNGDVNRPGFVGSPRVGHLPGAERVEELEQVGIIMSHWRDLLGVSPAKEHTEPHASDPLQRWIPTPSYTTSRDANGVASARAIAVASMPRCRSAASTLRR